MKKFLLIITIPLSLLLFALFSDQANEASKPYLAQLITSKMAEQNVTIEIEEYKLDYDHITLVAKVNQLININIEGDIDALASSFDLNYTIHSNTEQQLDIKGIAKGTIDDISISGKGDALSSKLDYQLEVKEQKPQNIQAHIQNAKIEEILTLAGLPSYAKGLFDLEIDMPKIDKKSGLGDALLKLHKTKLNSTLLLKEQNIIIPPNTTVDGIITSKLKGVEASIEGKINSNLAHLILKDGKINLETMALFSKFVLDITELKKLKFLTKSELNGALKLTGSVDKKDKNLKINILTQDLGGQLTASMREDKLYIDMYKIEFNRLLKMLGQPPYLQGQLNSKINIQNLDNPTGTISMTLAHGVANHRVLNKKFDLKLQKPLPINMSIKGEIKNHQIFSTAKVESSILNLIMSNIIYNINSTNLNAAYQLNIPSLAKLKILGEPSLRGMGGAIKLTGDIDKKGENLNIEMLTRSLGGELTLSKKGESVNLHTDSVEVGKLLKMIGEPHYLQGQLNSKINIQNLDNPRGTISMTLAHGVANHRVLNKKFDLKLQKPLPINMSIKGDIKNHQIFSTAKVESSILNLMMSNIIYNINSSKLNAHYNLNIPNLANLKGLTEKSLRGTAKLEGTISKTKQLRVTGKTHSFDGKIDFSLIDDRLQAKMYKVSAEKLFYTLNYPLIFAAPLSGTFNYHLKAKQGELHSSLQGARLLKNQLTDRVKQFTLIDLTQEIYNQTNLDAKLYGEMVEFNLFAKSSKSQIAIRKAKVNKKRDHIDAKYTVSIRGKAIKGRIIGGMSFPNITIDSTNFMQKEVQSAVKDYLGDDGTKRIKEGLKDLGVDKEDVDKAKDFIRGLF